MNAYLLSLILGIIEGLTEFLPVSSTAHLRIAEALLHVNLRTAIGRCTRSSSSWVRSLLFAGLLSIEHRKVGIYLPRRRAWRHESVTHPLGLTSMAFVVTAIPSFLPTKLIAKNLESLTVIARVAGRRRRDVDCGCDEGSMRKSGTWRDWKSDYDVENGRHEPRTGDLDRRVPDSVGGVSGTSRSMATIAGGQIAGMSRASALEFSFFLSIPTMVAATGYTLLKSGIRVWRIQSVIAVLMANSGEMLAIGFVVSFVVAYAAVAWFMAWVRKRGFVPFAVYRDCGVNCCVAVDHSRRRSLICAECSD